MPDPNDKSGEKDRCHSTAGGKGEKGEGKEGGGGGERRKKKEYFVLLYVEKLFIYIYFDRLFDIYY